MTQWLSLFFVVCSLQSQGVIAADSPALRAARYYAEGLERPLLQIRAGATLVQACAERLRPHCSKQQREAAGRASALTLLDELTLFPQRLADDPVAGITRRRDLERKMSETGAALLRDAGAYDRELFARFLATLVVCPADDNPEYLQSLQAMKLVNYTGFQAIPLDELPQLLIDETSREAALQKKMREAPPEDCEAARKLGEYLMQLMNAKLGPWHGAQRTPKPPAREFDFDKPGAEPAEEARRPDDRQLAQAVAGNFVSVVATELHLIVYPDSEARIKAIADAQGYQ